jgi:hypothetical protein
LREIIQRGDVSALAQFNSGLPQGILIAAPAVPQSEGLKGWDEFKELLWEMSCGLYRFADECRQKLWEFLCGVYVWGGHLVTLVRTLLYVLLQSTLVCGKILCLLMVGIMSMVIYLFTIAFTILRWIPGMFSSPGQGDQQCKANHTRTPFSNASQQEGLDSCCIKFMKSWPGGFSADSIQKAIAEALKTHPVTTELPPNWEGTPRIRQAMMQKLMPTLSEEVNKSLHAAGLDKLLEEQGRQRLRQEQIEADYQQAKGEMARQGRMLDILITAACTYVATKAFGGTPGGGAVYFPGAMELRAAREAAHAAEAFSGVGHVLVTGQAVTNFWSLETWVRLGMTAYNFGRSHFSELATLAVTGVKYASMEAWMPQGNTTTGKNFWWF